MENRKIRGEDDSLLDNNARFVLLDAIFTLVDSYPNAPHLRNPLYLLHNAINFL
jgi:hypothetical protein